MTDTEYMKAAVQEAYEGISAGHGGPFGSVIVRKGEIVGKGHNMVILKHDPTCHGEMEAIRNACAMLGTHDLSGCELYTTAEPCPMCLGAILWANIGRVYYGCDRSDTASIGFRDESFYEQLSGRKKLVELTSLGRTECLELFEAYSSDTERKSY